MTGPVFLDTNVVVYAFGNQPDKIAIAERLLTAMPTISAQVVNEFISVCRVKLKLDLATTQALAEELMRGCRVLAIDTGVIRQAMQLARRFQFSHWDSLIVAAALQAGCDTLYSEDMQHGLVIDNRLKICNPFISDQPSPEGA